MGGWPLTLPWQGLRAAAPTSAGGAVSDVTAGPAGQPARFAAPGTETPTVLPGQAPVVPRGQLSQSLTALPPPGASAAHARARTLPPQPPAAGHKPALYTSDGGNAGI